MVLEFDRWSLIRQREEKQRLKDVSTNPDIFGGSGQTFTKVG